MSKRSVGFEHDIQDEVKIKAINVCGRVTSMMISENGEEYRVIYWDDGTRHSIWVFGWEIE